MDAQNIVALDHLKAALPGLAAQARERAGEIEAARQLPHDFVVQLNFAGVYRVHVSRDQAALGGDLLDWLHMATTLAEADASTGWASGHGAVCSALIANLADPMASAAWSNLPRIEAEQTKGGLRISGRWGFGTGCTDVTYVGGMVPLPDPTNEGESRFFAALAPVSEARIDKTWGPVGLAGTGSHDIVFDDVFVPDERIFEWPNGTPVNAYPYAIFTPGT